MKFVNVKTKRPRRRATLDQPPGHTREHFRKPRVEPHQLHTYAELRQQIHDDLRIQHPEWVLPNGDCPMCDAYEARLMELLETSTRREANEWILAHHPAAEHGVN